MISRRIKIDKEFSKQEKQVIIDALDTWKKITCGLFDYVIITETLDDLFCDETNVNTISFLRGSQSDLLINRIDHIERCKIYGYAIPSTPNVIILVPDRIESYHDLKIVVLHEIGHILRIRHISDKTSIMSKYCTGFNKITRNDLIAFLSCCQWDYNYVKYDNDPFWYHEPKSYNSNRTKRFRQRQLV